MTRLLFIGLGSMGAPMAGRLVDAGYDVTVVDLDESKVAALRERGASAAPDPRDGVADADLVCTLVPADRHLRDGALGSSGFVAAMRPGTCFIDFSTVSTHAFEEVAEAVELRGGQAFDAAIGPGPDAAATGTLTVMVGGNEQLVEKNRPVLEVLGEQVVHCGARGSAKAIKLANNMVSAVTMLMNTEALLLAAKAGADPRKLVEVMQGTIANNSIASTVFPQQVFTRNFSFGFALELMRKDLALAESMATETDTSLPLGRLALAIFTEACDSGRDHDDVLRIVEMLEAQSGAVLRSPEETPSS